MAYQKFAINFTLIDQIVYEIITNQFTPISVNIYVQKKNIAKKINQ